MYDFPEVHSETLQLTRSVVEALREIGEDVDGRAPENTVHADLVAHWKSDGTYLSQSCGLPFVEELHPYVEVVGTFKWAGVSDDRGWYRTVIVTRPDLGVNSLSELEGLTPVVSNVHSLSGWCSLGCALSEVTDDPGFVKPYVQGGGHAGSLQALQDRRADFASIDPGTFQLLHRHQPHLTSGVNVIGEGPLVPATPLHVSKKRSVQSLDRIREAVSGAINASFNEVAREKIGIDSFVGIDDQTYLDAIPPLVSIATRILPR
jgi:ABC-type phosphate/phosphonate transport system substrate-binding protein